MKEIQLKIIKTGIGRSIFFWCILSFLLRLILVVAFSFYPKSTHTDVMYWINWTEYLSEHSISQYYASGIGDYPPGYIYYLKGVAVLLRGWRLSYAGTVAVLLYKLFPICFDCLSGALIYRFALHVGRKKEEGVEWALLYLFNPAVVFLSCIWGQIDSSYTFLVAASAYLLKKRKLLPAAFCSALAVTIKLQTLFWGPVLFVALLLMFSEKGMWKEKGREFVVAVVLASLALLLFCIPCGIQNVWRQCIMTLSQYAYASMNATNLWSLLGLNMVSQENTFLGISYASYGYVFMAITVGFIFFITYIRNKNGEKELSLFLPIGMMYLLIYTFAVRMHERYMFPAVLMLLLAYIEQNCRRKYLSFYFGTSLIALVIFGSVIIIHKYAVFPVILWVLSLATVCLAILLVYDLRYFDTSAISSENSK